MEHVSWTAGISIGDHTFAEMGEVASIFNIKWNDFISLTPERSGGYQRDSSTKTSWSLWSRSLTSDCRPSLSCPLHSQHCNRRRSFSYAWLEAFTGPSTKDLAETDHCCCWCTSTGYTTDRPTRRAVATTARLRTVRTRSMMMMMTY